MKVFALHKGTPGIVAKRVDEGNGVGFKYARGNATKDSIVDREEIITDPVSVANHMDESDESCLLQLLEPGLDTIIRRGDYYFLTSYNNLDMVQ